MLICTFSPPGESSGVPGCPNIIFLLAGGGVGEVGGGRWDPNKSVLPGSKTRALRGAPVFAVIREAGVSGPLWCGPPGPFISGGGEWSAISNAKGREKVFGPIEVAGDIKWAGGGAVYSPLFGVLGPLCCPLGPKTCPNSTSPIRTVRVLLSTQGPNEKPSGGQSPIPWFTEGVSFARTSPGEGTAPQEID